MVKTKPNFIFAVLGGLLLSFSLPFFNLGWLVFPALVLLLVFLEIHPQKAFSTGFCFSLIYFLSVFRWFWDTYPLEGLGFENHYLAAGLLAFAWLLTALAMSLLWATAFWFLKKIEKKTSWTALLVFPSIFTWFEYLRTFVISVLWFSPGNIISPDWTAGNLAYNLHTNALTLKLSSLLGIYGVTFFVAFTAILIFLFLEKKQFKKLWIFIVILISLSYFPFDWFIPSNNNTEKIKVAVIQSYIPSKKNYSPQEQLSFFKKQLELMDKISKEEPETKLIVFSEASNFFTNLSLFGNTLDVGLYFNNLFASETAILDNSHIQENSFKKSKTIYLSSKKGVIGDYDKNLLTPGGEYAPYLFRLLDKVLGIGSEELKNFEGLQTGGQPPPAINFLNLTEDSPQAKVGSLVCSDISSPALARSISLSGGQLIAVQGSFGFANGSKDLISQVKAMAALRAAENNKYLIYAANYGPSFIVSGDGKMVKESQNRDFEILTANVVLNKDKTIYNKLGDGPILLASLSVLVTSFFWRKREKKNEHN
ncbi:MAG: hypothetical protein HYT63_02400 [Candidatus Yanofskybacteria bacterium]|nr:hypothetical protein [Candidatus Yanofskybacteria bacterium]